MKSESIYLFSIKEERPYPSGSHDDFVWRDEYTNPDAFTSIESIRQYIYEWYEGKEKALAGVVASGRAEMEMTHHLDLQALDINAGRTNMLPEVLIIFYTPQGSPRKRYIVSTANARTTRLNPKAITE